MSSEPLGNDPIKPAGRFAQMLKPRVRLGGLGLAKLDVVAKRPLAQEPFYRLGVSVNGSIEQQWHPRASRLGYEVATSVCPVLPAMESVTPFSLELSPGYLGKQGETCGMGEKGLIRVDIPLLAVDSQSLVVARLNSRLQAARPDEVV